jgi:putative FmdB family regulatory protein
MPIYEYECSKCGRIDEVIQKFSDKPLARCKHCSGKLHKLISHSSFHLKGTGWYVTTMQTRPETLPHPPVREGMKRNPSQTNQKINPKNLTKLPIKLAEFVKSLVLLFCET